MELCRLVAHDDDQALALLRAVTGWDVTAILTDRCVEQGWDPHTGVPTPETIRQPRIEAHTSQAAARGADGRASASTARPW